MYVSVSVNDWETLLALHKYRREYIVLIGDIANNVNSIVPYGRGWYNALSRYVLMRIKI